MTKPTTKELLYDIYQEDPNTDSKSYIHIKYCITYMDSGYADIYDFIYLLLPDPDADDDNSFMTDEFQTFTKDMNAISFSNSHEDVYYLECISPTNSVCTPVLTNRFYTNMDNWLTSWVGDRAIRISEDLSTYRREELYEENKKDSLSQPQLHS